MEQENSEMALEDFSFKPLTEGLGFHQPQGLSAIPRVLSPSPRSPRPMQTAVDNRGELGRFYQDSPPSPRETPSLNLGENLPAVASPRDQILSLALDLLLIGLLTLFSLIIMMAVSPFPWEKGGPWGEFFSTDGAWVHAGGIFCTFGLVYFFLKFWPVRKR